MSIHQWELNGADAFWHPARGRYKPKDPSQTSAMIMEEIAWYCRQVDNELNFESWELDLEEIEDRFLNSAYPKEEGKNDAHTAMVCYYWYVEGMEYRD